MVIASDHRTVIPITTWSFRSPHASPSSLSHQRRHPHPRNHRRVPCHSDPKPDCHFPQPCCPAPGPPLPSPKTPPWSPSPRQAMQSQTPITVPTKLLPILNLPFPSCLPRVLPTSQTPPHHHCQAPPTPGSVGPPLPHPHPLTPPPPFSDDPAPRFLLPTSPSFSPQVI